MSSDAASEDTSGKVRPGLTPSPWQPTRPPDGSSWADFAGWVAWLDTAYELDLPPCWAKHEGLVHSLASLWHLWRSVYAAGHDKEGRDLLPAAGGPAGWHVQFFYPFRDRVMAANVPGLACRVRQHRPYSRAENLSDALDTALSDALATEGELRDDAERAKLDELGPLLGPAALIGVLYPGDDPYTLGPRSH